MQQLLESVYFNQNGGRYCVSLPWRESVGMLADNFELCQCCRRSLLSRFRKDPLSFEEYNKVMKEQLASGVLERVSGDAPDVGMRYYLSHHCVIRNDHKTTCSMVVYDVYIVYQRL